MIAQADVAPENDLFCLPASPQNIIADNRANDVTGQHDKQLVKENGGPFELIFLVQYG